MTPAVTDPAANEPAADAAAAAGPVPARTARAQSSSRAGTAGTVAAVLGAVALPAVVDAYTISIACTAIVLATLALSTQFLTGLAGLPSLGQAGYLGVGGYTAALLGNAGVTNGPLQLTAAVTAGVIAAAATAPLVLPNRAVAFLMVTFTIGELARTAASQWAGLTGGDDGLHTAAVTIWPGLPALRADGHVYLYLLACFLLLAAGTALLLRSRLQLVLRGVADHEPRLAALGHRINRAVFAGWLLGGGLAGAAGAFLIATNRYLSPADLGLDVSALALLAAAIGVGSMRGAITGAAVIVVVRDLLGVQTGGHALALLGAVFLLVAYRQPVCGWLSARPTSRLNRWSRR